MTTVRYDEGVTINGYIAVTLINASVCAVCGQPLPPHAGRGQVRKLCANPECFKTYRRRCASKFDYERGVKRRAELQKQGRDMVPCQVCGQLFEVIHNKHLKLHNLTINEYRSLYPNASLMSQYMRKKRGEGSLAQARYLTYQGKKIDDYLFSFFAGSMLGDGSIEKQKGKLNARYCEGGSNPAYMRWKYDLLSQYYPCTFKERLSAPHIKSGQSYRGWWVRTSIHPDLTQLHQIWYAENKTIPYSFLKKYFNEFSLAVWFCDDGHYSPQRKSAILYPLSFTIDEAEWLSIMLDKTYNLLNVIHLNKKGQPIIHLKQSATVLLREIVAKFEIPGMEYKYQ
ncbi:MAG: DNA endonuclease [Cyanobacteria bacterium RI_101]|nr:DNA endonuclease [Cyanobacteria bacterium RI_101]